VTTVSLTAEQPPSLRSDAVVVGVAASPTGLVLASGTGAVDTALAGGLREALTELGATGRADEVTLITTMGALPAPVVAAVGLGDALDEGADYDADTVRRAAGAAVRALAGRSTVAMTLSSLAGRTSAELVAAAAEGALLGAYQFRDYRSGSPADLPAAPRSVLLVVDDPKDREIRAAIATARTGAEAVALARDLVNTAPNDLPPQAFVARAEAAAKEADLDVEVLDEKALAKGGYGGILAVGSGSARPPRLLRIRYQPRGRTTRRVALVGKGVTFDSGGLSLKTAAGMEEMKSDMAGAAAVVAAVIAAASLKLKVAVTATVPLAENMPSGSAYRPGDVLHMYGGKHVEVRNTDAEGRLVLADAIVRAAEDEPDYLIDAATLTGAQITALGNRTMGVLGTEEFRDRLAAAGTGCGEAAWAMPLPPECRRGLDSPVADIANIAGDRAAGMLVAGAFLHEFVADGVQWAHLDVAGPAFNTGEPWGYTPKGGTGVPVRTIVAVLREIADNG